MAAAPFEAFRLISDPSDSVEMGDALFGCIEAMNEQAGLELKRIDPGSVWVSLMNIEGQYFLVVDAKPEPVW